MREEWIENAIKKYGCKLESKGALVAYSGEKTGRSPKDKRIVLNDTTKDIWWRCCGVGCGNVSITQDEYDIYLEWAKKYIDDNCDDDILCVDGYAGWDEEHKINVRVYCANPYHALFMKNMLVPIDDNDDHIGSDDHFIPEFTIYNVGHVSLTSTKISSSDNLKDALIALRFDESLCHKLSGDMVIYGTEYAGEMKKGLLTYVMWKMPLIGHLPLHSSFNVGKEGDGTLFLGLSGTGKTTISADVHRSLVGDDEHVWTDKGIFNVEGGCYAKCIGLDKSKEPEIFNAIRYGAVLENVVMDDHRVVDYNDDSITQNTRASYPLHHIPNSLIPALSDHPKHIIFLTCDASGLLPPLAILTPEQAMKFFICGYTSKIPGTEVGVKEPKPVFSSCFGEPFIVWSPKVYGNILREKLKRHECTVYLLNTGWIDGEYGVGERIPISYTRAMVDAIHYNTLKEYETFPIFNYQIPKKCPGVPKNVLNPYTSSPDKKTYLNKLENLLKHFELTYDEKCMM